MLDLVSAYTILIFSHVYEQVVANMRGASAEEVAERILNNTSYPGLQVC